MPLSSRQFYWIGRSAPIGIDVAVRRVSSRQFRSVMSDRRRAQRFAFTRPASACLHLVRDVVIVESDADRLAVLSPSSSATGETFALRVRGTEGREATVPVRTIVSQPVVVGTTVQYRIDLRVIGKNSEPPIPGAAR